MSLQEFLAEAELGEYYLPLVTRLKVSTVEHLKYVQEDDLQQIGMTRPEMRRLHKFYKRHFHQGAISKIRKAILKGGGDGTGRTVSTATRPQRETHALAPSATPMRLPGKHIIPADAIQLGKTLGRGEFGLVQQGVWRTDLGKTLQVAVKRLSKERMNSGSQNFLKEAAIMQDVHHQHIVQMFGVMLDGEDNIMLVTELAPMRSLLECIKDISLRSDLPVTRLCDYAVQVCDGMSYLENKRLVHRDLAARNILVFNKNLVKISDLGLSRLLGVGQDYYQSRFSASLKLPIAWCAPECINFLKFTPASDVWSFGVLLWEFFTYGFQPWAGLGGQQILQAIDEPNCQRLDQPELCTSEIYKLMRKCWAHDPNDRPMFSEVLLQLPQLKPTQVKALKDYPRPVPEKGYIPYRTGDVIAVINKSPVTSSLPGLIWKGVLANGNSGLFDPTNAVPFIEPNASPVPGQTISIVRKESTRRSGKKIRVDMISHPHNDMRHTGHIGYDGAVFGDVAFIADNYDKLPVKTGPGNTTSQDPAALSSGRGSPDHEEYHRYTNSQQEGVDKSGYGQSWISQESMNSQSTYSQESLNRQSTCQVNQDGRYSPSYLDIEDDTLLSDFKVPSLGSSFDFGPSFMDEVLKALDEKANSECASSPGRSFDPNIWAASARREPPLPAPREPRAAASATSSTLSAGQPQRLEHPKEKKQTRVKSMSASDERMLDTALARARELTSHMIGGSAQSPPVSPSQGPSFFGEDMGLISRLKNSIKRSSSPKNEHKRNFSDDLEHKGDLDEVSPEAQQAYNMLVVKGSFKEKSNSGFQHHSASHNSSHKDHSASHNSSHKEGPDSRTASRTPPRSGAPSMLLPGPPSPHASPPSHSLSKSGSVSQSRNVSISAPVAAKTETRNQFEAASCMPHADTQTMDTAPVCPDKCEAQRQLMMPGLRATEANGSASEDFKNTSSSLEHPSAQSSQRSSTGRSTTLGFDHGDCGLQDVSCQTSKLGQDADIRIPSAFNNKNSFSKEQATSLFLEDPSGPSPQEVLQKLREQRLHTHSHKQHLAAENEVTTSRSQVTSHTTPGGAPLEGSRVEGGSEEVDTNPLRMLRGGAIPLRSTGRSSAGTGNISNRGVMALRVPRLNFSRHNYSSDTDHQRTDLATGGETAASGTTVPVSPSPQSQTAVVMTIHGEDESCDCAVADVRIEGEKPTDPQAEDSFQVANLDVLVIEDTKTDDHQHNVSQEHHTDLTGPSPETRPQPCIHVEPCIHIDAFTVTHEAQTNADHCPQSPIVSQDEGSSPHPIVSQDEGPSPPRLPPRRSQSLNENSEKTGAYLSVLSEGLRRSNSFEEGTDTEAPALPPRKPHAGRTPLNIRPRERKFPLQIHMPSQDKDSRQQQISPRLHSKHILQVKSPVSTSPSSPSPLHGRQQLLSATPSRQQASLLSHHQPSTAGSPSSPQCVARHRQPGILHSFMSHSLDSSMSSQLHHHSVDLPPAYDISHRHPNSSDVADSEPTHMLLDVHTLNLPFPLSVSLPPSADLSSIDEPTHVSLSSLIDNKLSWSATVTSACPLSAPIIHRQNVSAASPRLTRVFHRTLNNDTRARAPTLYPDSADSQSPPADLPPAPPTPSYREKLRCEQQKPKVVRSISHTPHKHMAHLDHPSSSAFRARSASTNSPQSHSPHTDASHSSSHRVLPHRLYPDGDDDNTFFAEAPADPHPYSQTPFHPLLPPSPKDGSHSSVYSTISLLQASPDVPAYLTSSSVPQANQSSSSSSPMTSRLSTNSSPIFRQNIESYDTPLCTHDTPSHAHDTPSHIHTPDKLHSLQLAHPSTNLTHLYSAVSLPSCGHQSPNSWKTSTNSCSTSHRPGLQTTSKQQFASPISNCQQMNIFTFPGAVRAGHSLPHSDTRARNPDLSPGVDDTSSSEVSPLMFASYSAASSVSYEDLRQFAFDRQKNCEEIETLLKIFSDQVTVDECMTALESTQWDVARATKYLQLKKLLSLGVADVHKCKDALSASGWDLQCAAETLLESSRTVSAVPRGNSTRPGLIPAHNRPSTPEVVDV